MRPGNSSGQSCPPAGSATRVPRRSLEETLSVVAADHLSGYWLHLDVDVLDPDVMPAVDSPDPGGLTPEELITLLTALAPAALGAHVTVFDPDLDPDGRCADLLVEVVATGLRDLGRDSRSSAN